MDTSIAPGPSGPPTAPPADSTCSKQPNAANQRTRLHSEEAEEEEEEDETSDTVGPPNKKVWFDFYINGNDTFLREIHFVSLS